MIRILPLAATAALFAMPALACDGFGAHDAYARFSTSMSQSGAAFMVLHNHGTEDCHITGARSDVAQRTELHTHEIGENGVARMIHVEEGFPLPADGELVLQRGGDHVMLMGLNSPLEQGETFDLTLIFADGSESTFPVTVDNERMPGQMPEGAAMNGHDH
ncbi:copper chaperone PCu(A)C [Rhodobacter sp. NTK016B]|uniref:copper chaperone PCu(A)C n=1 Tax=Rhodobacter sp. NTK016B TaxID=2759676 RepID=UPI001A8CB2F4|nr:copper chaperone PCu(A)C [Rhodobacter sp. NTK016B]MBN8294594.1 copper chaperone PCu(A)C [Rhodobacter sp. NTK016B]